MSSGPHRAGGLLQQVRGTLAVGLSFAGAAHLDVVDRITVGRGRQKTNHDAFILQNGFREIWIRDSEYSFAKDGEFLGSAAICIHPAAQWLTLNIYNVRRRVGLTNKDVYMPLEPPSKGGPLIAMWLPEPPKTK